MNSTLAITLVLCFAAGAALGLVYFSALWKTVRSLSSSERPLRLLLVSFFARAALLAGGLYFVMCGRWERMAAAVAGIIVMRIILTRLWGPEKPSVAAQQTTI